MRHIMISALCLACLACASTTPTTEPSQLGGEPSSGTTSWDMQTPMGQKLAGEKGSVVEASVRVEKVDLASRLVTVKKPDGASVTLKVGPEIKRLNEIKPGDMVVAQFVQAVAYELRKPTQAERASPTTTAVVAGRNDTTLPPGAGAVNVIHSIVTIEAIDRKAGTISIKGPTGETAVVAVQRPENFERIRVGDTAAVTYMEAIALSIEPKKG